MMRIIQTIMAFWVMQALMASGPSAIAASPVHDLRPFDAKSLASIRQSYAGKPFALAFWSIHCEPCREEMAEWKSIQRKYPKIPIVLVSTDVPSDRPTVIEFLSRYDPGPAERWIFADEFTERVRFAVDRTWRGELPRTYLFDARHRSEARSGRFDRRWIENWISAESRKR